jgi:hypothetical protein
MPHVSIHSLLSLHNYRGGNPVTKSRSPGVRAELLTNSFRPERSERGALAGVVAIRLALKQAIGDSSATPSTPYVNPDAVHLDIARNYWDWSSGGVAYARSRYD